MRKNDWVFTIFLLFFVIIIFFGLKEDVLANKENHFFISFEENSLFRPLKKNFVNDLEVNAFSYYSILIEEKGEKVFLSKNINEKRSIASISKLMTAVIVLDNYNLEDKILVSKKAISVFGDTGKLKQGEVFTVKTLLNMLLVESSNDAAEVLAEKIGRENFVSLMNKKAKKLKMNNTVFNNPSGLDFENGESNYSSAKDLKNLIIYIVNKYSLVYEILSISEIDIYHNGYFHHKAQSTNYLLNENSSYVWGKTGYTTKAKDCIVLVMKRPFSNSPNSYIINIIIGADDRFREARIMEQWIRESFYW